MSIDLTPLNIRNAIILGMVFGMGVIAINSGFMAFRDVFKEPINFASLCRDIETGK